MSGTRFAPTIVSVRCMAIQPTGEVCACHSDDHVHMPLPCGNGKPERHHDFQPPRYVTVLIEGVKRRLTVPVATNDGVTVNVEPVE